MSTVTHIRKRVLGLTQNELAGHLEVTQPTVCRWESQGHFPDAETQSKVRDLAKSLGKPWNDTWFFEVPETEEAAA